MDAATIRPLDNNYADVTTAPMFRFQLDDKRTLVVGIEYNRSHSPTWAETVALGEKWMRFFRQLGLED